MNSVWLFLLLALVAAAALILLDYYQEGLPYYGDGSWAKYLKFLLNIACPELFYEITGLERETFDRLVAEIREANLLVDG